jgi:hypothetical protein
LNLKISHVMEDTVTRDAMPCSLVEVN